MRASAGWSSWTRNRACFHAWTTLVKSKRKMRSLRVRAGHFTCRLRRERINISCSFSKMYWFLVAEWAHIYTLKYTPHLPPVKARSIALTMAFPAQMYQDVYAHKVHHPGWKLVFRSGWFPFFKGGANTAMWWMCLEYLLQHRKPLQLAFSFPPQSLEIDTLLLKK